MKTAAALLVAAGLVAATPLKDGQRRGNVMIPYKQTTRPSLSPDTVSNATADFSSTNWSGVGFTAAPSVGPYTSVTGTFTVPQPQPPPGSGSGTWYGTAWVGIDGDTVSNALFQGGIDWAVSSDGNGGLSYDYYPWIEWIPDPQVTVNGMTVNAGDSVTVTCTSTSSTTGTCTYVNNSNGQSVSANSQAPSSSATLSGQNVEWIVEDFSINGGLAPFANYGSVAFSGCTCTAGGNVYGIDGAELITLVDNNGNTLSSCTAGDNEDFSCSYQ